MERSKDGRWRAAEEDGAELGWDGMGRKVGGWDRHRTVVWPESRLIGAHL